MRILLPALMLLIGLPVAAEQLPESVLGSTGELYTAKAGTYGVLFPDGEAHGTNAPILALQIVRADEPTSLSIVPGTANARVESQPVMLYEHRTDSVVLMWLSRGNSGKYRIDFATHSAEGWSPVRSLTDNDGAALRLDSPPAIAVSDDAFDLAISGGDALSTTRRVIHLLYPNGGSVWYTPLIFVEGAHVGWIESLDLGRTYFSTPTDPDGIDAEMADSLRYVLGLEVSDGERSVIAAFANAESGRVGAVEISLAPLHIELLGDYVRDRIFAEAESYDPGDVSSFSDIIRAELIIIGMYMDLHPGIVEFASDQVGDWIDANAADYGYGGFQDLGDDARELAIYVTGSVSAAVVADPATGSEILEIDLGDFLAELNDDSVLGQLLEIQVRSDVAAPAVGEGAAAIFPSRDGRDLLIGWKPADENGIRYVESRAHVASGAWSAPRGLNLGDSLTLDQAIALLEQKIR